MDTFTTTAATSARRAGRRLFTAGVVAVFALGIAACGDDDDDTASDDETTTTAAGDDGGGGAAPNVPVEITEFQYTDASAAPGGTLEIINSSGAAHTFTADDGSFDVEVGSGETGSVTVPAEPGEYGFHCEFHSSMAATLTVG